MVDNLLARMRRNPAADWQMRDVQAVCIQHGVQCDPPTGGGSHWKVWRTGEPVILTVPARRPIRPVYIRKLVAFIEKG